MTDEEMTEAICQKHEAMEARTRDRRAEEGVVPDSTRWYHIHIEEIGRMQAIMTPEERRRHREMSELGCLPGDVGGGWDLIHVPDDGKDH